jgi:hypothetical protein
MATDRDTAEQAPAGPGAGDGATAAPEGELARRSANGFEVFGQSLAATGPSIAIAGTVAVIYLTAGRGTIWSYVLATVVVVLVGYSIAQFARRTAAAGSLYSYTASGLGRGAAFAGGWGLVFGYAIMVGAVFWRLPGQVRGQRREPAVATGLAGGLPGAHRGGPGPWGPHLDPGSGNA